MVTNRFISFIVTFFAFSAIVLAQKPIELQYPGYSVAAVSQFRSEGDRKPIPLLTARLTAEKGKSPRSFGIFAEEAGESAGSRTVLEIIDAAKNVIMKNVTLDEYFGKESASWHAIGTESKTLPEKLISAFRVQSGAYEFKFIREIAISEDRNLPLGRKMTVTYAMEPKNPMKIRIKFLGTAAGSWKSTGRSFAISDGDTSFSLHPALVFHPTFGSTIEAGRPSRNNDRVRFTVTTKEISLSNTAPTIVFTLEAVGTTISFQEHIEQQVKNLQAYFNTQIGKPEVAAISQANTPSTRPGDTLMFKLYSHNIGTAPATESSLNNIIPAGAVYLEGSAEGKGTEIMYTRTRAALPQNSQVTNITWKYLDPIYPGEERIASFKVLIQ